MSVWLTKLLYCPMANPMQPIASGLARRTIQYQQPDLVFLRYRY